MVHAAIIEGETREDIAERLDLSKGAVSVRLHRGLTRLRDRLEELSALPLVGIRPATDRGLEDVWDVVARRVVR